MHSSRMHTARSSSRRGVCLSVCWDRPPGVGLETPQPDPPNLPPWEWAWRPSPGQIPLNFPLGCGPGDPPSQIPSTSSLGVGLETCKACWVTTPSPQRPAARHAGIPPAMHAGIPPPCEQNHRHV